jgi:hypothetical protein
MLDGLEVGQVDPSVKLPPAVRAIVNAAEDLHKETYKVEELPADPQDPPAATSPQESVTPQVTDPPQTPVDDQTWEHKYKSMKGRYDAEVPRLKDQLRGLSEQVSNLNNLLATMQAAPQAPPAGEPERLITDEEVESYGKDFLDVVGKKAKEIAGAEIRKLQSEIAGLKSQIGNVATAGVQSARDKMLDTLDESVPNWRELNEEPKFLAWLGEPDVFSGATRHELLKQAYDRNESRRVLAFFQGFLTEEAALNPASAGNPKATSQQPDQNTGNKPGKVPLASLAAPGRAGTAAGDKLPAEKPIITTKQITDFYHNRALGKYAGREKEADAFEAQIFDAQKDGRIR